MLNRHKVPVPLFCTRWQTFFFSLKCKTMENQPQNFAKTLKIKRFAIQKNIHLFMREMMRYFDIYLLAGAIVAKGFVLGIIVYTTAVPQIILGVLFTLEFFFLFTRIAMEFARKKNQQLIFVEVSNNRRKYSAGVYLGIIFSIMYTEWSWAASALALFLCIIYFYSEILLASAAVAIHTKDVQFTEKLLAVRSTIVLAEKKEPQIIAHQTKTQTAQHQAPTDQVPNEDEIKIKKKFDNLFYRLRLAKSGNDTEKAAQVQKTILDLIDNTEQDFPELGSKMFEKLEASEL